MKVRGKKTGGEKNRRRLNPKWQKRERLRCHKKTEKERGNSGQTGASKTVL